MQTVTDVTVVKPGVRIFTGDNSGLKIRFSNGTEVHVGEGTYFLVNDFGYTDNMEESHMFLNNGSVKVKIDAQPGKRTAYSVITPLFEARAKGTEFEVFVDENGDTRVEVKSGEVEIIDLQGEKISSIEAGEDYEEDLEDPMYINDVTYDDVYEDRTVLYLSIAGSVVVLVFIVLIIWKIRKK